jgi:hypothetical protein
MRADLQRRTRQQTLLRRRTVLAERRAARVALPDHRADRTEPAERTGDR